MKTEQTLEQRAEGVRHLVGSGDVESLLAYSAPLKPDTRDGMRRVADMALRWLESIASGPPAKPAKLVERIEALSKRTVGHPYARVLEAALRAADNAPTWGDAEKLCGLVEGHLLTPPPVGRSRHVQERLNHLRSRVDALPDVSPHKAALLHLLSNPGDDNSTEYALHGVSMLLGAPAPGLTEALGKLPAVALYSVPELFDYWRTNRKA